MRRRGENLGFAGGHTKMVRTQSTASELYHTDDRRRGGRPDWMWAGWSAIRWYDGATEDIRPFAHAGMRTWKQTEATLWPTENPTRAPAGRMAPPLPRSSGTSSDREGVTSLLGSTQGWASAGTRNAVSGHRPQKATSPRLASGSSCSGGLVGADSFAMTGISRCSTQR